MRTIAGQSRRAIRSLTERWSMRRALPGSRPRSRRRHRVRLDVERVVQRTDEEAPDGPVDERQHYGEQHRAPEPATLGREEQVDRHGEHEAEERTPGTGREVRPETDAEPV